MLVLVEGDIYIKGDKFGFTIEQKSIVDVKDKETKEVTGQREVFNVLGSYGSIAGCINGFVKLKIVESEAATIKELLQEVKEIRDMVTTLIKI